MLANVHAFMNASISSYPGGGEMPPNIDRCTYISACESRFGAAAIRLW
jgi:hypothetical protein